MHAGRTTCLSLSCKKHVVALVVSLRGVAACALVACLASQSPGQPGGDIPFLAVPSGAPPADANPQTSVEAALSAALQAAGVSGAGAARAPEAVAAPINPFVGQPPSTSAGGRVLLPFNPGQGAENVVVDDNQDGLISLMVREGSLRHVVAMIAETQKLNIVFAGPNDVTVTASFDRQPWQTVLDALLSSSGHTWTTREGVIFVSSLEVADFMPPDAGGQQVQVFELDFASATDLDQAIQGMLSPAGRSWVTESNPKDNRRTKEAIAVVDYPAFLARIDQYVCQADQPPRQVFIQAHILQVDLSDTCRNGINFENIIRMSSTPIRLRNVGFANPAAASAFMVNVDGDGVNGLDGLIELLQNTSDAKTLASPEIHAVSGQFSRIQIGDQLPYRNTATTQTAALESAQFLDVGVVLEVTPRVTRDGRILMRIKPEVSSGEYRPEAEGLPSKKTTQVETDVLMCSGEGMVIGGLIQEEDSNVQSKLPFLGDIPYVGILFQKRQIVKSRKEIIVTLRPYVLPYTPIMRELQDEKVWRTEQPLTQGAIHSFPRPYEPRMPDTFDHRFKKAKWEREHGAEYLAEGELMMLPPTQDGPEGDFIEELPPGATGPDLSDAEPALH